MTNKMHSPLIRAIYLYLFALLGLVLLTIGGVRFVDMGLKAFIFTKADEEERLIYNQAPPVPCSINEIEKLQQKTEEEKKICLSKEEKSTFEQLLVDYKNWKGRSKIDYVASRRHRDASLNLAMILIGLPLYFYHWRIIRQETKDKKEGGN